MLFVIILQGDLSLIPKLFIYFFMSGWTREYLSYTLGHNIIPYYYFLNQTLLALAIGNSIISCATLTYPHPTSLLFSTTGCSRVILYIPCPSIGIRHFSKDLWFLSLENGIRNQDPGAGGAHYYRAVRGPKAFQWGEL